jgi:hypothetical protein
MKKLLLFLFLLLFHNSFSQDLRGSEIYYKNNGGLQYSYDVYLYTQTSIGIDHSIENFNLGFGTLTGTAINLANDITEWYYTTSHTYPGSGTYQAFATDSFRIAAIQNINNSSSEYLSASSVLIINPNFIPDNSSVVMLNKQTEVYQSGGYFTHHPMAYDVDGDSLVFSLVPTATTTYSQPPGITINTATGFVQMPVTSGIYAINIQVEEWRHIGTSYSLIGITNREMLIDSNAIVGIEDITKSSELGLYPNPAHNNFTVNHTGELKIYDVTGRLAQSQTVNRKQETVHCELNAGLYFVTVEDGAKLFTQKLVIE